MLYVKRFNLNTQVTNIEFQTEDEEEARSKCKELCDLENEIPHTTCVFAIETTVEDSTPYDVIIQEIFEEICDEYGLPMPEFNEKFIEGFKKLL